MRKTLELAFQNALAYLENLDSTPVGPTAELETLRARLGKPLRDEPMEPEQVIAELTADVEGGIVGSAGGRFFGWVIGGALESAVAADWLAAAWDQNAAMYPSGPAASVVEEVAGGWLKEILGIPAEAGVAFVTGCQMAHVTCLAAARHCLLARSGWDVEDRGLAGAPAIRIVTSTERHGTLERAARLLGLGAGNIRMLASNDRGQLDASALDRELQAGNGPAIVALQAGDVNTGAFDAFESLIPVARRHGAWVHVDGAFGLWAAASPQYREAMRGAAEADSWATDGHKWLNVPYDSGYAFVRDASAQRASMSHTAPYLPAPSQAREQIDWNPEWSRRARGFATYAAIRELGRSGIAALVERCCGHARRLVDGIGSLPGAEILWRPTLNQGLVRFHDDRRTDETIAAIVASGEAYFSGTTWRGRRAMRVSVCNWRTTDSDVDRAVHAASRALDRFTAS